MAFAFVLVPRVVSVSFATGAMAKSGDMFGMARACDEASPINSEPSSPAPRRLDPCRVPHSAKAVESDAQKGSREVLFADAPPVFPTPAFEIDDRRRTRATGLVFMRGSRAFLLIPFSPRELCCRRRSFKRRASNSIGRRRAAALAP